MRPEGSSRRASCPPARGRPGASPALVGLICALLAAIPVYWLRGFTVDDALIPARVAANIHAGLGHRFNGGGSVTDAVTPLGWAYVLAPFAGSGPLSALRVAKWLGVAAWLGAAALLGARVTTGGAQPRRFLPLGLLVLCTPLSAWAAAGLETGVVTLLCTLAVVLPERGPIAAGLAAAWRPELLPWAAVLSVAPAALERRPVALLWRLGAAIVPAVAVALLRVELFGRPAPLAVLAKPPDTAHGLFYVAAALLWSGPPLLVLAPRAVARLDAHSRVVLAATGVHLGALIFAGGDWMPLFRLMVPVLPGLLLVAARLAEHAAAWPSRIRLAAATAVCLAVAVDIGPDAARTGERRLALISEARVALADVERVATLDEGWVGAATAGAVLGLSGVTDERVALLPGPHHDKKLPSDFLERRQVDALVLLTARDQRPGAWRRKHFARPVETRIASLAARRGFRLIKTVPLGGTPQHYVILKRRGGG